MEVPSDTSTFSVWNFATMSRSVGFSVVSDRVKLETTLWENSALLCTLPNSMFSGESDGSCAVMSSNYPDVVVQWQPGPAPNPFRMSLNGKPLHSVSKSVCKPPNPRALQKLRWLVTAGAGAQLMPLIGYLYGLHRTSSTILESWRNSTMGDAFVALLWPICIVVVQVIVLALCIAAFTGWGRMVRRCSHLVSVSALSKSQRLNKVSIVLNLFVLQQFHVHRHDQVGRTVELLLGLAIATSIVSLLGVRKILQAHEAELPVVLAPL